MREDTYNQFVSDLCKSGEDTLADLTPENASLLHFAVGVSGEAGELLDAVKKAAIYKKPLDRVNVIEELGDLEFYMSALRGQLGITREETMAENMLKLAKRYNNGYSNEDAQFRADKV